MCVAQMQMQGILAKHSTLSSLSEARADASTGSKDLCRPAWHICPFVFGEVWAGQLFDWPRTGDEDVHESPGALLPVRTRSHVGDTDERPEQIEGLQISTNLAALDGALHQ